jgi:hypothetical protein
LLVDYVFFADLLPAEGKLLIDLLDIGINQLIE